MPLSTVPTFPYLLYAGQPLLLPLTQSLYVSGTVASTEQVLVDIGTGYYVEVGETNATQLAPDHFAWYGPLEAN